MPLYQVVALKAQSWNENQNIGLVVGATYPEELENIREICPDLPILMPGIGAQGGNLELSVQASLDGNGRGVIVNASRGVLYSSQGSDFADAARKSANDLRLKIESSRRNL